MLNTLCRRRRNLNQSESSVYSCLPLGATSTTRPTMSSLPLPSIISTLLISSLLSSVTNADSKFYGNYTNRDQLQRLNNYPAPGRYKHGWVFETSDSDLSLWRSCDVEVNNHHSELSTPWLDITNDPHSAQSVIIKLLLRYTVWCDNRMPNCDGKNINLKVEAKNGPDIKTLEHKVPIPSFFISNSENDYLRPQTVVLPAINGSQFRISIADDELCIKISELTIFSDYCAKYIKELAVFPESSSATDVSKPVFGECVLNALDEQLRLGQPVPGTASQCTSQGSWVDTFSVCKCIPGFTPDSHQTQCIPCMAGFYKEEHSNNRCNRCPENSRSIPGSSECACLEGFYRAINEPNTMGCANTPSEPRDVRETVVGPSFVKLAWLPPWRNGGRRDVEYLLKCENCYPKVEYRTPRTNFTVSDLTPNTQYTFRVYSVNSVSEMFFNDLSFQEIRFRTKEDLIPSNLRAVNTRVGNSASIAWDAPAGFKSDSYCILIGDSTDSVAAPVVCINGTTYTRNGLQPGQYKFRVAVQLEDGSRGTFTNPITTTVTAGLATAMLDVRQLGAIVGIIGTICILFIVLCMGMVCLYKKQTPYPPPGFVSANSGLGNGGSPFLSPYANYGYPDGTLPLGQTFSEPTFFDDIEQMLAEFVHEIPEKSLKLEMEIASHMDESIWSGSLVLPNEQPLPVTVKTIYHDMYHGGMGARKMAIEASTMGQLNHPNVLQLHGMSFSPDHWSLVTECTERGSLQNFVLDPNHQFTSLQLVHMLRGISCGMRYLADLGYVHKVLNTRCIIISDQLVCKIGGFDLRAILEESNCGTREFSELYDLLTPWMAPEVLQCRKFSSASDVWAFGVVVWQTMSRGDEPYGACRSSDICEMVNRGQKMGVPKHCPAVVAQLINECWKYQRNARPAFCQIQDCLENVIRNPISLEQLSTDSNSLSSPSEPPPMLMKPSAGSASIADWLRSLGLPQYTPHFSNHGYFYLQDMNGITAETLADIGISSSKHRKRLLANTTSIVLPLVEHKKELSNMEYDASNAAGTATFCSPVHSLI